MYYFGEKNKPRMFGEKISCDEASNLGHGDKTAAHYHCAKHLFVTVVIHKLFYTYLS